MPYSFSSTRILVIIFSVIAIGAGVTVTGYFYFSNKLESFGIKSFSKPITILKTPMASETLTSLFSITTSTNELKIAKDKLASIWFEQSFSEGKDKYHAVFIKNQNVDPNSNEVYASHAEAPVIGVVVYKLNAGKWVLFSKQTDIGVFGSWGDAPAVKQVQKLAIAKGHTVFLLDIGYSGQGYTNSGKSVFSYRDNSWSQLGYLQTSGDNAGVCDEEDDFLSACWKFDGQISLVKNSENADYPDLQVKRSGTMGSDDGKVVAVENSVYSFNGEEYLEVGAEVN